jgi:predicted protein tyrosine phosphatase
MPLQAEKLGNQDNVFFMMNMPTWYMNLPNEEKVRLAKVYAKDFPDDHTLTEDEIADLLKVSDQ